MSPKEKLEDQKKPKFPRKRAAQKLQLTVMMIVGSSTKRKSKREGMTKKMQGSENRPRRLRRKGKTSKEKIKRTEASMISIQHLRTRSQSQIPLPSQIHQPSPKRREDLREQHIILKEMS
jgi:hypothetical protein